MLREVSPQPQFQVTVDPSTRRSYAWIALGLLTTLSAIHLALQFLIDRCGVRIGAVSAACAPLYAYVRPHFKGWLALPLLWLALLGIVLRRTRLIRAASSSLFMLFLYGATLTTVVLVAALDGGFDRIVAPYERLDLEYSGAVALVTDPLAFLRDYARLAPQLPMHCQNHPPGAVLFLWLVSAPFRGSVAAMAWITVLVASVLPVLTYAAARALIQDQWARRAALLLLACPSYVLFSATSMDAVFGVLLAGAILAVVAASAGGRERWGLLLLGGLALGLASLMTYTVAVALVWIGVYLLLAGAVRLRVLLPLITGMVLPTAAAVALGYRPLEVFIQCVAAHHEIMRGTAHDHPVRWLGLAIGNAAAFGIGLGVSLLAAAVYLLRGRSWRAAHFQILWACMITLLVAAGAPVYTLEVERIWSFLTVPFVLGVAVAGSAQLSEPDRLAGWRLLLWAGMAQTLLTEIFLETYW